jgi:hypothetical protein
MRHRILPALGLFVLLGAGPNPVGALPTMSESPPAPAKSLEGVLREISTPSGIQFRIAPEVARDRLLTKIAGTTWPDVVRDLLRGYNYVGTWDHKGRLRAVSITGRNGDGAAPLAAVSPLEELFSYRDPSSPLPARYNNHASGSVYPVKVPIDKLRRMQKGQRVSVNLPDGRYELVHDNVWQHENGDLTWVGYVDGPSELYRTLLTLGNAGAEGQIRTPGGLYQVESEGEQGWLVDIKASGLRPGSFEGDEGRPPAVVPASSDLVHGAASSAAGRAMDQPNSTLPKRATLNSAGLPVIDVMLLYTSGLSKAPTKLNSLMAFANQGLVDSRANAVLRLVAAKRVKYPNGSDNDAALDDLTSFMNGFERVPRFRQKRGADLVLLVRPFKPHLQGSCGTAWVNGSGGSPLERDWAFGVLGYGQSDGYYCSNYTLAHEIGHLMGATHDRAHARVPGKYEYSYGYGIEGRFGDIMSYYDPEVGLYSNPDLVQCDGLPCGIAPGQPLAADVALTLDNTAATVSAFVKSTVP